MGQSIGRCNCRTDISPSGHCDRQVWRKHWKRRPVIVPYDTGIRDIHVVRAIASLPAILSNSHSHRARFGSSQSRRTHQKKGAHRLVSPFLFGAPGEIRTPDLLVRSQTLYPTELRAQKTVPTVILTIPAEQASPGQRKLWRRERDSNPRWAFDPYALSRGAPSTTRPSLRRTIPTTVRSDLGSIARSNRAINQ